MRLSTSPHANENYLAEVVEIQGLRKHTNADRLQCVSIHGNNVITSLETEDGDLYVYFPVESAINVDFLSWSNSFEDKSLNMNPELKGFFNKSGRVRCIKLRNERSEGYIVPLRQIEIWMQQVQGKLTDIPYKSNITFDMIDEIQICKKYVVPTRNMSQGGLKSRIKSAENRVDRIIPNQFRFHMNTSYLHVNINRFHPEDVITITKKLHGTSFIVAKLLCKKPLKWYEQIFKKLRVQIQDTHYGLVYASRKVVKNRYLDKEYGQQHFYQYDLWKEIAGVLEPYLEDGMSFYGECVGFTKDGGYIQKNYDYGCQPNTFELYIYRITYTNPSGEVFEFSSHQIQEFCTKVERVGMKPVPLLYHGNLGDHIDIHSGENFHQNVLDTLSHYYLEKNCDMCKNKVPAEGIVVRKESLYFLAYKMKSFRFKEQESKILDDGIVDMESSEDEVEI